MAKNRERRGFLARWYRRLRWLRRLVVIGGVIGGIAKALRGRSGGSAAGGPGDAGGGPGGSGRRAPIGGPFSPSSAARMKLEPSDESVVSSTGTARTLVAVPPLDDDAAPADSGPLLKVVSDTDADAPASGRSWVDPLEGGECPPGYPIKANDKSGIYHVPEGRSYKRTAAQRCYPSAEAAEADGYRPAKA
jgi:hypothetical protein